MVHFGCPARKVELDNFGVAHPTKHTFFIFSFFQISTVKKPLWFMVYGLAKIEYGHVLKKVRLYVN